MDAMISALEASQVAFTYVTYLPNRRYDQKLTDLLQVMELQPLEHRQSWRRRGCIVWRSSVVADMDFTVERRELFVVLLREPQKGVGSGR